MISDLSGQIDHRAQWIKTCFVALMSFYDFERWYGDCVFLTDSDIIKRALLLVSERQDSVAVGYAIGNGGWCQRSMISVVTFV